MVFNFTEVWYIVENILHNISVLYIFDRTVSIFYANCASRNKSHHLLSKSVCLVPPSKH